MTRKLYKSSHVMNKLQSHLSKIIFDKFFWLVSLKSTTPLIPNGPAQINNIQDPPTQKHNKHSYWCPIVQMYIGNCNRRTNLDFTSNLTLL